MCLKTQIKIDSELQYEDFENIASSRVDTKTELHTRADAASYMYMAINNQC